MSTSERDFVGEITLEYLPVGPCVRLEIDEVGWTRLTMDQADSLASIREGWIEKCHQAGHEADTARCRSQGAKDGWEIRRAKQKGSTV